MSNKLTIGLVGFGCVGSGLYDVLNRSNLIDAHIKTIVVKDPTKERTLPAEHFHYDVNEILLDTEINVVVELINDSQEAFDIVRQALLAKKHVVTANKKMLAEYQSILLPLAKENNVSLLYEGAVAGAIPIIRNLEEYYNNDSLTSVEGILNGTSNYILTKSNVGIGYKEALKDAQELGFAEADPTLDVDGYDSKYKLILLIKHAFGLTVQPKELVNIGIRGISEREINYASEKGYRIKLLAKAEKIGDKVVSFVAPHCVEKTHAAFGVNNEFNAVVVGALFSDQQFFSGKGAGSHPTGSAVLSDVSALKFDYQYEYRKTTESNPLSFTSEAFIKVYIGSRYAEALNEVPFYSVEETYLGANYAYQTGWVKLSVLHDLKINSRNDLSLLILPEPIHTEEGLTRLIQKNLISLAQTAAS